jgi:antitoxin component YwqK of YwqJK toxin-antitoxin module
MSGNWVNSHCSAKNGKIYREIDGSLEYSGPLDCNNREGFGTEYYANGKIRYTGVFAYNKYEDKNVSLLSEEGRLVYKGDMKNGLRNGHGVLYHEDSRKKY